MYLFRILFDPCRLYEIFSHRFTASFIELLLTLENAPRHRVLSALVKQTTGFSLTDAMDLEEEEDPIPPNMMERIKHYAPVGSVDRLVKDPTSPYFILFGHLAASFVAIQPVHRDKEQHHPLFLFFISHRSLYLHVLFIMDSYIYHSVAYTHLSRLYID